MDTIHGGGGARSFIFRYGTTYSFPQNLPLHIDRDGTYWDATETRGDTKLSIPRYSPTIRQLIQQQNRHLRHQTHKHHQTIPWRHDIIRTMMSHLPRAVVSAITGRVRDTSNRSLWNCINNSFFVWPPSTYNIIDRVCNYY